VICAVCHQPLYDHEADRYACLACQDRTSRRLAAVAGPDGQYAQLERHLIPERRPHAGTIGRSASGSTPPCSLDTLDLMAEAGPILGLLETWVRDWETYGRVDRQEAGSLQQRVDQAVGILRFNLGWACAEHPAVDQFIYEIDRLSRRLDRVATGERPARAVPVCCATDGCGGVLHVTVNTPGETCDRCKTEYGHSEALALKPALRNAA
jgi:hypothetical protein